MKEPVIVNLEPVGFSSKAKRDLQSVARMRELDDPQQLDNLLSEADVIITRLGRYIGQELLARAPCLRAIATATTGLDHIDLEAARAGEIEILSLKGEDEFLSRITVTAELHWGLLLAAIRHLKPAMNSVAAGEWDRDRFQGTQLSGKTIGLVGYGRLGRLVGQYARAFGMSVLAFDRIPIPEDEDVEACELDALLARSDVLSIHLSLNESSQNLLDADRLALLRSGAIVVNTARGEVIDEMALAALVESGQVAAIATDVLCGEAARGKSFPNENPLWRLAQKCDRVLITPHVGGACPEAMRATEEFIAGKIVSFLSKVKAG